MAIKRCRLERYKQIKLLEMFVAQVTARTAADLVDVNYHTAHLFYHKLREIITAYLEAEWPMDGEVEVDESYFGGVRKGTRGRGAAGKVPVFGLLKRGGHVYACMIPDASSATLMPIIRRKVLPDSIVYTDCWTAYNALDVSEFRHERINHSMEYASGHNHINGIENFWNQAKRVLRKYNGIPKQHFHLFLKECEFRFNYGSPKQQMKILKQWCKLTTNKTIK
jgi:transposase